MNAWPRRSPIGNAKTPLRDALRAMGHVRLALLILGDAARVAPSLEHKAAPADGAEGGIDVGKCSTAIREIRFVIADERTEAFVFVEAEGDCPHMIAGWHREEFPAALPVTAILEQWIGSGAYLSAPPASLPTPAVVPPGHVGRAEAEALVAAAMCVQTFAGHSSDCAVCQPGLVGVATVCSCGFQASIEALEETAAGVAKALAS